MPPDLVRSSRSTNQLKVVTLVVAVAGKVLAAVAVVGILEDTAHTDDSRHLVGLVCIVASCS